MLIKIAATALAAGTTDRHYANDVAGNVFFPRTKEMGADPLFAKGSYAYVIKTQQTQTRDEDGNLVALTVPRDIFQITALFASKQEAISAAAEVGTLEAEVMAEVRNTAVALQLTDAQVASLASAW